MNITIVISVLELVNIAIFQLDGGWYKKFWSSQKWFKMGRIFQIIPILYPTFRQMVMGKDGKMWLPPPPHYRLEQ